MAPKSPATATTASPPERGRPGPQTPGGHLRSDGLEGCEHAVFEILSNSDRRGPGGFGSRIVTTRYEDGSFEVQDFGRGMPVDFNQKEGRYNWELIFCELYAGGKYNTLEGESYEYPSASTAWAPVRPSIPRNTWTWRSSGTGSATPCTSNMGRTSAACKRNRMPKRIPAPSSVGNRISRCSPTSRCLPAISGTCSNGRPSSIRGAVRPA